MDRVEKEVLGILDFLHGKLETAIETRDWTEVDKFAEWLTVNSHDIATAISVRTSREWVERIDRLKRDCADD